MQLPYDKDVETVHQSGVKLSVDGHHDSADWRFAEALAMLRTAEQTSTNTIHQGRVFRDVFLNALRYSPQEAEVLYLRRSVSLIESAGVERKFARHRRAELGASVLALGRWEAQTGQHDSAKGSFRKAAWLLVRGDNSFYLTSAAFHGAREAASNGRRLGQVGYLGLASVGVLWAFTADKRNKTEVRRKFHEIRRGKSAG